MHEPEPLGKAIGGLPKYKLSKALWQRRVAPNGLKVVEQAPVPHVRRDEKGAAIFSRWDEAIDSEDRRVMDLRLDDDFADEMFLLPGPKPHVFYGTLRSIVAARRQVNTTKSSLSEADVADLIFVPRCDDFFHF